MESYYVIIIVFFVIIYYYFNRGEVVYHANNNSNKKYLVRNTQDKDHAVKTLEQIEQNLRKLIKLLMQDTETISNKEMYKYIKTINDKLDSVEIQESPPNSKYTSYSVNKGELLVFCIRSKETFKIHDMNELLYVAIHEIAHIGCPEVGHTDLFFKINKYLINKAMKYNIYKYIDYSTNNKEYCGMKLTTNIG